MIRISSLILALAVLTSCGLDHNLRQETGQIEETRNRQIAHWIEQEEFGKAWDALLSVEADDPEYADFLELRKELKGKIRVYEESVIRNAEGRVGREQWEEAIGIYRDALARLPKSTVLKDQLAALHGLKRSRTEKLRRQLQIIRAEELVKSFAVYDEISAVNPSNEALKKEIAGLRREGADLALHLSEQARSELDDGKLEGALKLIELAEKLSDEPSIRAIAQETRSKQENSKSRARRPARQRPPTRRKQQTVQDAGIVKELERFDRLYQNRDYPGAADVLNNLGESPNYKKEISNRQIRLKKAVRQHIDHLFDQGVESYSQENYSLALRSWSEVLRLEPSHQKAREYTERVTRIVNKIKELREKQQSDR